MRSGWWRGSIYWVLLFRDRFAVTKPLSQMRRSTLWPLQDADPTPSFGGFGLSQTDEYEDLRATEHDSQRPQAVHQLLGMRARGLNTCWPGVRQQVEGNPALGVGSLALRSCSVKHIEDFLLGHLFHLSPLP